MLTPAALAESMGESSMASIADNVLMVREPAATSAHLTKLQQVRFPIALLLPGPVMLPRL